LPGKIGLLFAKAMKLGFGARVIAYDVYQSEEVKALGIPYVSLEQLYADSDIISLHVPLLPSTKFMVPPRCSHRYFFNDF
jgi:D-lactate dehydrogenase